ncbi:strictosidine synthase-like 2 [Perilla frutescens var. frutescens]|nr:strictosidine synthase-like 2 [Perilla frutescens var. frutescens]
MTIPIVFQAKAMTIKLIISSAFLALFLAIFFVSFDDGSCTIPFQDFKNDTSLLVMPMPGGAVGPESFAFDRSGGGPFTGVSDGRIIRWRDNESRWVDFAVTSPERDGCVNVGDHSAREHICGRPLGLRMNEKTGDLYIADAYMGLVFVGPNGGLSSPLVKEVDGIALGFTNSLDIDHSTGDGDGDGVVYFTDSSTRFQRRNYVSVIISGDDSGRLMKFDPQTRNTTLLLDHLKFPNGVALSINGDFLLFVETTTCKLYKYWLKSAKAGNLEVVAELPGFPDNLKRNSNGDFWVGINSPRGKLLEWIISNPWIGNTLLSFLPFDLTKLHSYLAPSLPGNGMGIRLDRNGNVAQVLDSTPWHKVSEVHEENGYLWIGSVVMSFSLRDKISTSSNF